MTGLDVVEPLDPDDPGITPLVGRPLGSGMAPEEVPAEGVGVAGGILMEIVGRIPEELRRSVELPLAVDVSEPLAMGVERAPDGSPVSNNPEEIAAEGDRIEDNRADGVGITSIDVS